MTESEKSRKIHNILECIFIDNKLDSRHYRRKYTEWRYDEFKHIAFNEYVVRGLFEILRRDGICTDVGPDSAIIENDKGKSAYYMNTYAAKAKLSPERFWEWVSRGNNFVGLTLGVISVIGLVFALRHDKGESPQVNHKGGKILSESPEKDHAFQLDSVKSDSSKIIKN